MKKILLSCLLFFFVLMLLSLRTGSHGGIVPGVGGRITSGAYGGGDETAVSCAPPSAGAAGLRPDATGRYAPVFPGWGHYHYKVSTTNDSAQFYFDQGLSLYYSYHLTEAAASFKEATRNDSNCVMAWWGEALAMGPYYNDSYYYKMPMAVLPVIEQMKRLAAGASPNGGRPIPGSLSAKERDLAGVMSRRYDADTAISHRFELNRVYSGAIRQLIDRYPGDLDIKALYVDGRMIEHAWDMWDNKGVAKPWTPELIKYCEEILAANPQHPAALHYHIHLEEASQHPGAALHSADVLQALMPGVAHMVHMSSHMYQRTGLYVKGVSVNDRANAAVINYGELASQLHLNVFSFHYHTVEAFCALNGGMYEKAMQIASESRKKLALNPLPMQRSDIQYHYMMPAFVQVRLGKWKEVLDLPEPDSIRVFAGVLSDFARGLAFVRTGRMDAAQVCLDKLRDRLKDPVLAIRVLPENAPIKPAMVAEGILAGEILFAQKKYEAAMAAFTRAIEWEDGMTYGEPKDWPLPARHYAGACLLKLGRAAEAEKLYREDLVENPGNGWGLLGIYQSLLAQHKEAGEYKKKYMEAFAAAEVMPTSSAY
jgi:tetratricopeptide (TPR) repeat protein